MVLFHLAALPLALSAVQAIPAPRPEWYLAEPASTTTTTTSALPTQWYAADPTTTSSQASSSAAGTTSSSSSSSAAASATGYVSSKKGVGYNDPSLTRNLAISWAYDWQSDGGDGLNEGVEYYPMLWSDQNASTWPADVEKALAAGSSALLGFNEPDIWSQSDMSISTAVSSWLSNLSPYAGRARLISPAVSNSPQALNIRWLEYFFGNCTQCAQETSAAALHWYSDEFNTTAFKTYFQDAYQRLQRPIWITEFGVQRFTSSSNVTEKQAFLEDVIPWMEAQPWIEKYGTFVGRFVNKDGSLTALGETYSNTV
ncbi:hypothetical protein JCM10207_008256 [Rhodosporidiobolus poonsookiae]